jgi:hypothetical protein
MTGGLSSVTAVIHVPSGSENGTVVFGMLGFPNPPPPALVCRCPDDPNETDGQCADPDLVLMQV